MAHSPSQVHVIDSSSSDQLRLRIATLADLDAITQLAIESFPDDPERDYRFPHRHEFPDDHWVWTRLEYQGYLEQPLSYETVVIEAVPGAAESAARIVALGIWDVSNITLSKPSKPAGVLGDNKRRDADLVRMRYFAARVEEVFEMYFSQYGTKQLHLVNLATHRDYRRRGCGAALCNWGIKRAEPLRWPVTVFGSPMGKLLYISVGFRVIGTAPLRVPGEEEGLTMTALVHDGH